MGTLALLAYKANGKDLHRAMVSLKKPGIQWTKPNELAGLASYLKVLPLFMVPIKKYRLILLYTALKREDIEDTG